MSDPRRVPPRVEQAVWSAVCVIPGVTLDHVSLEDDAARTYVTVGIDGWSPSLHELAMEWRVELPSAGRPLTVDEQADHLIQTVLPGIAPLIHEQRERSLAGLPLECARPIRRDGSSAQEVAHLHIDASTLAGLIARGEYDGSTPADIVRRDIAGPLSVLHRNALDIRGGPTLTNGLATVEWRTEGGLVTLRHDPTGNLAMCTSHGPEITLTTEPIPETAAVHAVGRPLRDLVHVSPHIDDRIIRHVDVHATTTIVLLEPCEVPIRDVLALGAHEAVEEILRRISSSL